MPLHKADPLDPHNPHGPAQSLCGEMGEGEGITEHDELVSCPVCQRMGLLALAAPDEDDGFAEELQRDLLADASRVLGKLSEHLKPDPAAPRKGRSQVRSLRVGQLYLQATRAVISALALDAEREDEGDLRKMGRFEEDDELDGGGPFLGRRMGRRRAGLIRGHMPIDGDPASQFSAAMNDMGHNQNIQALANAWMAVRDSGDEELVRALRARLDVLLGLKGGADVLPLDGGRRGPRLVREDARDDVDPPQGEE